MTRGAANAMAPTTSHTTWDELPAEVHDAITSKTGTVHRVETIPAGLNSSITARLDTDQGKVFLKGTRSEHAAAARREANINAHVTAISPRLRWELECSGWHLLGFDHLHGHRADYTPGSPDLSLLTATLTTLASVPATPDCRDITDRWADAAHRAEVNPELFAGDRLLHTDLNPHNVLITTTAAHLVDWSWPSRGAAWIDTACAALWLIAEGHTPHDAETWAERSPTWSHATPTAISAYAATQAALWADIAKTDPDQPWKQQLYTAADSWCNHRLKLSPGRPQASASPRDSDGRSGLDQHHRRSATSPLLANQRPGSGPSARCGNSG
jgi:hypothetical protein